MADDQQLERPGIYNIDYFSGAQVALYIGDIWVDEVTSMSYEVRQPRRPLYGYADTLYKQLTKGQVLVQGQFTINFKEAGYLWLVLQRNRSLLTARPHPFFRFPDEPEFKGLGRGELDVGRNIEQIINGELNLGDRNESLARLATAATLTGFSSGKRASGEVGKSDLIDRNTGQPVSSAESVFEKFENEVWGLPQASLDAANRRADDPDLNPFDIFLAYGDFDGDDRRNHTIRKLSEVSIVTTGQEIVIDGQPIQEQYGFIAKNIV